jgi:hypothetical protein
MKWWGIREWTETFCEIIAGAEMFLAIELDHVETQVGRA